MCEPMKNLRFEALGIKDLPESVKPVIDAAFAAADESCCGKRQAAVSRAVFLKARELGFRVAWGDLLNDKAPDFYIWPDETWHKHTIRELLERERALPINLKDVA